MTSTQTIDTPPSTYPLSCTALAPTCRRTAQRRRVCLQFALALLPGAALALESEAGKQPEPTSQSSGPGTYLRLYGLVGAGLTYKSNQAANGQKTDLANNTLWSSHLGLRGREDLGGGLSAEFRLESGIATDTGTAGASVAGVQRLWNRQAYIGLGTRGVVLTLGRQFHAHADRAVRSLDVYNLAGSTLHTTPFGLFGVNRFSGNDTRVDNSIKLRVNGPDGVTLGVSAGLDEGAGRSAAFDLAHIRSTHTVALYGAKFRSPTAIASTGEQPDHQIWGVGGQWPLDPRDDTALYLNYTHSLLDATAANRPAQRNQLIVVGLRAELGRVNLRASYTHDKGTNLNNIVGRDGKKVTWVQSAEYGFSLRTSAYAAVFRNHFSDGYRLDPVNLAALSRDPTSAASTGYSVGVKHAF